MDIFDETVQKAKTAFGIAVKKTGDFVSVSKQKFSVVNLENKLTKAYAELGKLQFKELKDVDIENPEVASAVFEIKQIISEIKILLDEIDENEGKITCPKCGGKSPSGSTFCNKCGEHL